MSSSAYSDFKSAWHLDSILKMRANQQVIPKHLQLVISDLCNHDCNFCSYRLSEGMSSDNFGETIDGKLIKNPNRKIPTEKCLEILDDCADLGIQAVQFTGGGEPTVHPEHIKIFSHAQELGLQTAMITNGYRLMPGWENVFSKMSWIRVSVDAGTAETYSKVRRIKYEAFNRTLSNISDIISIIDKKKCLLGVGFVITLENYHEIKDFCFTMKLLGVPYVRLTAMFSTMSSGYYNEGIYNDIQDSIQEAEYLFNSDTFKVVNLFGTRISDLDQASPDYDFCGYQHFTTYIGGDLKVYRCCNTAYTDIGEVGDLSNQRLKDWIHSESKQEKYKSFNARSCNTCPFGRQNKVINYMLDEHPTHINFV